MKKFLAVLMFCAMLLLSGCDRILPKVEDLPHRFEILEVFELGGMTCWVLRDTGTQVLYLVTERGIVQVIVDYEGKPVTWDPFGG